MRKLGVLLPIVLAVTPAIAQDHAHHGHDEAEPAKRDGATLDQGPPLSGDHAADSIYGADRMAAARKQLYRENGRYTGSMILFDLAEVQIREGREAYHWEGEAWFGGDINKLVIKTEGEGRFGDTPDQAELQLLYTRAVAPYWNAQIGVRHDILPNPSRTHAVISIEGLAPYWIDVSGQIFLSNKGELTARAEASHDMRITQSLILTPRAEINLSAQNIAVLGVGSGLTDAELGLRLRYERQRKVAPYLGVEWSRKLGDTARFARASGQDIGHATLVAGVRFWF